MNYFNPHDVSVPKGRPPKDPVPDPVFAASIWEGFRHNKDFKISISKVLNGETDDKIWSAFQRNHIAKWCLERMQCSLPSDSEDGMKISGIPSYKTAHGKHDLLSTDQIWPDTPDWFREEFPRLVNDWDLGVSSQLGGKDIASELLSLLRSGREDEANGISLTERDGEEQAENLSCADLFKWEKVKVPSWAELEILLQQMQGRLILLPKTVLRNAADTNNVLRQVKALLNTKHGNRHAYPSRGNWDAYLNYAEGFKLHGIESEALSSVLKKMDPKNWASIQNSTNPRKEILDSRSEKRVGIFGQIDITEQFIFTLFISP